ncbi:MAG: TetR family transcriptional regulator [Phyllobacteriaceae bacterium]|jgi:AcrR family transcriptional regulator|nr:TetR family transcriptional regulator [Phyllobacteriaceae bacterium]
MVAPQVKPQTADHTRERILAAAEGEFSRLGFEGAGMKGIAVAAGVSQGLLHYHFGTKDGLYAAVIERRSAMINAARHDLLDAVDLVAPDAVEAIFRAVFEPPLGPEGGGQVYARIFASLAVGPERDQDLVRRHYDATALRFIDAIQIAEPRADREVATWAYSFAIGALIGTVNRDGRPGRLMGRKPDDRQTATGELVRRLAAHATGGLYALIEEQHSQST